MRQKLELDSNQNNNKLAALMLGNSVLHLLVLLFTFLLGINTIRIANKPVPSLVMLDDGKAIATKPVDRYYREPGVIVEFVKNIMTMAFTWDGYLPAETPQDMRNPIADQGVSITHKKSGKTYLISTSTYEATSTFDPELREQFLQSIAESFPQSIFKGNKQAHLIIKTINNPIPIEGKKNAYSVTLVSSLIVFENGNTIGEAIDINRKIYLRAVEVPKKVESSNPFSRMVYKYRQAGLEIFDLEEFEEVNLHSS